MEFLKPNGFLVLETGSVFPGQLIGAKRQSPGEVVFFTGMTGYQEVLTDPSYAGQIVVMTYPLQGNYGINHEDGESTKPHLSGLIVNEICEEPSHLKSLSPLSDYLAKHDIVGLAGVATRNVTVELREQGCLRGWIIPGDSAPDFASLDFEACRVPADIIMRVTTKNISVMPPRPPICAAEVPQVPRMNCRGQLVFPTPEAISGLGNVGDEYEVGSRLSRRTSAVGPSRIADDARSRVTLASEEEPEPSFRVVLVDLGCKLNIVRALSRHNCEVTVVPANTSAKDIAALKPDGVLFSNGPGDPMDAPCIATAREIANLYPCLGICMGHQVLAIAFGATTAKMKFGHHGANHPVRELETKQVSITSQNHGFAVDPATLPACLKVTHVNVNDGSCEGVAHERLPWFAVQFHPEACPGPWDAHNVFQRFLKLMYAFRHNTRPMSLACPNGGRPKILVIGSGPIVIGQAAEFDYAGTQACKSLAEEGYDVILVNSNPATIMTDSDIAARVYMEPLTVQAIEPVIARERPAGILASLGGQTALNLAVELCEAGVLEKYDVRLLGTPLAAVKQAEDRLLFKKLMSDLGEPVPESEIVRSVEEGMRFVKEIGPPVICRPAFTLGGTGGGIANTEEQARAILTRGIRQSPIGQVLVERSIKGWKEIEYEVMRDANGTAVTVCNMENLDPVGVHTGDSIVLAPSQTLSDKDYHRLRTASIKIIQALRIEGGCNVQLAQDPNSDRYCIIEVNPRVSRSSALASKATGYPIAKIAAKIAVGRTLDEIINPVTGTTYASFEPTLDYVVAKVPRWPFDKFPTATRTLGTQMKATGEVMALGRTFEEALQKALRSLEIGVDSLHIPEVEAWSDLQLEAYLKNPPDDREIFALAEVLRRGVDIDTVFNWTMVDRWFLRKIQGLMEVEARLRKVKLADLTADEMRRIKALGFSDRNIATLVADSAETTSMTVMDRRFELNVIPTFSLVDTCAAEFASSTPYYFSTYRDPVPPTTVSSPTSEDASAPKKMLVLGSGPIRIGQGVEFDYCSVRACWALQDMGYEAVMMNSNPETVSTDFDTAHKLYFEPLTLEDVVSVIHHEKITSIFVQFGGQTAINLAVKLARFGIKVFGPAAKGPVVADDSAVGSVAGTTVLAIDRAEDRGQFRDMLEELKIPQSRGAMCKGETAIAAAESIGYPVVVRPSYVIGGRAMVVAWDNEMLTKYLADALSSMEGLATDVMVDEYLPGRELEVDAVCDGVDVLIPGIFEHVERAGVHSGDSIAVYPPQSIAQEVLDEIVDMTKRIAVALPVVGLLNIQFVLSAGKLYVLEVNPRASRTVPIISKVTRTPIVQLAVAVQTGRRLRDLGYGVGLRPTESRVFVKAPVFSFGKITGLDISLGPEMKSTGEVLGIGATYEEALTKAFNAAGLEVFARGGVLVSGSDRDKDELLTLVQQLVKLGLKIYATEGTAQHLAANGVSCTPVSRDLYQIELILRGAEIDLVICLPTAANSSSSLGFQIRRFSVEMRIPCMTSIDTATAWVRCAAAQPKLTPQLVYEDLPASHQLRCLTRK